MPRLLLILLILTIPSNAFAAFAITDNFDSYADGDLTGENGGSGWSAAWTGNTEFDVQGTTVYAGAKAVSDAVGSNQSHTITRDLSSETSGNFYIAWRVSSVSQACPYVILREGASGRGYLRFPCTASSGAPDIYDSNPGSYDDITTGLSANTWYILHVEFDTTTDQYRARIYDGSWGSYTVYKDLVAGTGISRIDITNEGEASTSGTFTFDEIQTTDPFAVTTTDLVIPTTTINNGSLQINNGSFIVN